MSTTEDELHQEWKYIVNKSASLCGNAPSLKMMSNEDNPNMAKELLKAFERHSDKVLLVGTESGREWTGANLLDHCARLATGLIQKVQLRPNDVVMTVCDHTDDEIAMALGVILAGGALFGTAPSDGQSELETLCSIVTPQLFIVSGQYHERVAELRRHVKNLRDAKIVWLDRPKEEPTFGEKARRDFIERDQVQTIEDLLKCQADLELINLVAREQIKSNEHIFNYMLTSGSTGRPKVVSSTHFQAIHGIYSIISACHPKMSLPKSIKSNFNYNQNETSIDCNNNQVDSNNNESQTNVAYSTALLPLTKNDVVSGDLPLDHGAGFNTMLLSFWMGSKFIVMPSYDVDAYWQAVNDYKISFSISSTTFCYKLFKRLKELIDNGETERWDLSSFKYICCCGAKLAFIDLIRDVRKHYPHIKVVQGYGCTEVGFISALHIDDCDTHLHSTGFPFPGVSFCVMKGTSDDSDERINNGSSTVDESGRCKPNERGELWVTAESKFERYICHQDDDAEQITRACQCGIFYKTGDWAHVDELGRLYIHGRIKDTLFLMEDWKILPVELEDVVNQHPLVEMSAVVGVPDPNLPGCHAPKAFVKLISLESPQLRQLSLVDRELSARLVANDLEFISKHIYEFVASQTARPKHLTGGVRILNEFPRNGLLNKVDRKVLKQMD